MGDKLRRFFAGRYGMDALNKLIFIVTFLLLVVLWLWPNRIVEILFIILLVIGYYRCFSRNIAVIYGKIKSTLMLRQ